MSTNQKLRLGDTEVVRIGLGTNRLGNTPENVAFVKEAVAAGVSHIDTAHTYAGGESEETIGAALSPIPDDCVVATKGGWGRWERSPRGAAGSNRGEPSPLADGQHRPLLPAPD